MSPSGRSTRQEPALDVEALSAGYPGVLALEDVGFTLDAGRICALVGANGSGKSTLFATLLGLRSPVSGQVRIFGGSPRAARRQNLVSYVPQHDQIDPTFPITVDQTVMMGRYAHMGICRRARPADHEAVAAALEQVGLTDLRSRTIGELSGGQRRRTLLARSIAQRAPLMLLDEPFAGVDRASERLIIDVLHHLRDSGTTMLVSTHHVEGVPDLAEEVILLHRRLLAAGPPSEVLTEETLARGFGTVLGVPSRAAPFAPGPFQAAEEDPGR